VVQHLGQIQLQEVKMLKEVTPLNKKKKMMIAQLDYAFGTAGLHFYPISRSVNLIYFVVKYI
jgi:hypothetical protein